MSKSIIAWNLALNNICLIIIKKKLDKEVKSRRGSATVKLSEIFKFKEQKAMKGGGEVVI